MKTLACYCSTIILTVCMIFTSFAQSPQDKLKTLIETEYAFAKEAKEKTNKAAFLNHVDDETILFTGTEISKGKPFWENRKEDSTLYVWYPVYAGISSAGDIGFTSGPAEFLRSRKKDEKSFPGSYISVWKYKSNRWVLAVDIGVYPQPVSGGDTKQVKKLTVSRASKDLKASENKMQSSEGSFLKSASLDEKMKLVSSDAFFYRIQKNPLNSSEQIRQQLLDEASAVEYSAATGSGLSQSGDLAYVYGLAKMKQGDKTVPGYYVRIWKLEDSAWKVVLDVLTD